MLIGSIIDSESRYPTSFRTVSLMASSKVVEFVIGSGEKRNKTLAVIFSYRSLKSLSLRALLKPSTKITSALSLSSTLYVEVNVFTLPAKFIAMFKFTCDWLVLMAHIRDKSLTESTALCTVSSLLKATNNRTWNWRFWIYRFTSGGRTTPYSRHVMFFVFFLRI